MTTEIPARDALIRVEGTHCHACNGTGEVEFPDDSDGDAMFLGSRDLIPCSVCKGTGNLSGYISVADLVSCLGNALIKQDVSKITIPVI